MDKLENIELEAMIKDAAKDLNIVPYPMAEVKRKVKEYYESPLAVIRKLWYSDYIKECIVWSLKDIRKENPVENQMYCEMEEIADSVDESESKRISEIIEMLSTKKLFLKDEEYIFTLHQVLKWLTLEQCERVKKCILVLKDCCDAIGICSILEGANINVSKKKILLQDPIGSDLSENEKKYKPAAFVKRLELMTKYIKDTADKKFSETEKLGTRYWLRSTGSDPHCEGRHALFLVNKNTARIEYVYKPHDLSADNVVVGENGMLVIVNELLSPDKTFATVHIEPEKHLETYVEKLSVMSKEKAESYFYKAGMLQVITDAMAVTDLHQDNIIPTKDGPLIIDAEADFFRANFSGLLLALTWVDSDKDPRNASFLIDEGEVETVRSWKAFQNEKLTYRQKYKEGQKFMLGVMRGNKDYLLERFDEQLRRVKKSRLLPMSTKEFSDFLQTAMGLRKTKDFTYLPTITLKNIGPNSEVSELASGIVNEIIKKFANIKECYIFTEKAGVYLSANRFGSSIMETFENGTIIAMHVTMDGDICLDDKKVGYLYDLGDETNESVENSQDKTNIVTNITTDGDIHIYDEKKWSLHDTGDKSDESTGCPKQLSKEQVIQMIKDHFTYVIENYKISDGG